MSAACRCGREKHAPEAEFCGVCKIGIKRFYREMQQVFWRQAVDAYFKGAERFTGSAAVGVLREPVPPYRNVVPVKDPPAGMPFPTSERFRRRDGR